MSESRLTRFLFGDVPARPPRPRQTVRIRRAFSDADLRAIYLIARVKLVAMALVSAYLVVQFPDPWVLYWVGIAFGIGVSGVVHYRLEARGRRPWYRYAFMLFDIGLLTFAVVVPNPGVFDPGTPPQLNLRFNAGTYYFVFIAISALSYSPRFVVWTGVASAFSWAMGNVYYLFLPGTVTLLDMPNYLSAGFAEKSQYWLKPNFVSLGNLVQDIVMILLVSLIAAVAVLRTNRLIARQLTAERDRANLSRYFSPNMVDELAETDRPLGAVQQQDVAVLFADIVSFTDLSERIGPAQTMDLLREFHSRMAGEIFAHSGTVDKYIGDCVMASFGVPRPGPRDALNALRCAKSMLETLDRWNAERRRAGQEVVELGIGVAYGPAVLGDMGDERRLEFALIGDTVNVASRLEAETRKAGAPVLFDEACVEKARAEAVSENAPLPPLVERGRIRLRGRSGETTFWTFAAAE